MVPDDTKLEAETRKEIDEKLEAAGWAVQDKKRINLMEKLGVAVREMDTDTGPADYMLFIDGAACGIIEAKREGAGLGHVDEPIPALRHLQNQTHPTLGGGRRTITVPL